MKKVLIFLFIYFLMLSSLCFSHEQLPNFVKIKDKVLREQAFFAFILPKILAADRAALLQRKHLLKLYRKQRSEKYLTFADLQWLKRLSKEYGLVAERKIFWRKLMERVDSIPVSLALAQSDKETAAGTTRFARIGNNLYGKWCFIKGCGMAPLRRAKNEAFEVQKYSNVEASVRDYMHNLNTNRVYSIFRKLRAEQRKNGTEPSGVTLASGLLPYSSEHEKYISAIRSIILKFQLEPLNAFVNKTSFTSYLSRLALEAKKAGVSSKIVDANIRNIHLLPRTLSAAYHQPEGILTYQRYLSLFISLSRITEGKEKFKKNKKLLKNIAERYHIQPEYLISLWGLETDYGKYPGDYPELSTLATLDYAGYRSTFFHKELIEILKLISNGDISSSNLYGSWAGAMGQCQFLPSRYLQFAVDYDHKGKKDIWKDTADVLASTANFLHQLGWNKKLPMVREVILPKNFPENLEEITTLKTVQQWKKLGVKAKDLPLVGQQIKTSLLLPTDKMKPAYLIYPNFNIIKKWNNSSFYALAVGVLANKFSNSRRRRQMALKGEIFP